MGKGKRSPSERWKELALGKMFTLLEEGAIHTYKKESINLGLHYTNLINFTKHNELAKYLQILH